MTFLKRIFGNWWVLSILAAVIVAVILTLILPLIVHPLGKLYWRLGLLALVVLVWAGFAALRVFSARNASDRIAKAMEKEKAAADDEGAVVGKRLGEALSRLHRESGNRRDYLYSRPWYVIIGPPGAGKTTALLSSGLRFPFSDSAVKGVGGTRNLDFWFADEAVIVDTAGRYTSQDSSEDLDRKGWLGFLDSLRKNRPLQPINGVLVAIGVDTLMTSDVAALDRHADTIRRRLSELKQGLEISAPVYVVFTKTDLVAGFTEFFDDLDVEQRRAVVGHTFDVAGPSPDAAAIAGAFDEITESLGRRGPKRLQDELDARRRGLIVGFPAQFAGLRNAVARLLDGAFPIDAREGQARIRGIYFSSGVQQGTPLDRLLGGIASVYETPAPAAARSGRAYFLNRLLMEVIFGEAGLAEGTSSAKVRRGAILTGGLAAIGVVSVLILAAWISSFVANLRFERNLERQTLAAAEAIKPPAFDLQTFSENDRSLEDAAPVLDLLRKLPRGYDERRRGGPPFPMGLGLYQSDLSQLAEDTYLQALQRIMLPRLLLRLEAHQRDHLDTPQALYGSLKTYLLLGGRKPGGGYDPASVKAWVTNDWEHESLAGADHDPLRQSLTRHLDAMLADKSLGSVWRGRDPLLTDVVDISRNRLATLSAGERAYVQLRDRANGAPWKPILPPDKLAAFANAADLQRISVPFFFTREGYRSAYLVGRTQAATSMIEDKWVLNQPDEVVDPRRMLAEVAQLYANEYIATWKRVQKAPRPANYFADHAAADAMLGEPSPYKLFLKGVLDQTNMAGLNVPPTGIRLPTGVAANALKGVLGGALTPSGPDAGSVITDAFASLSSFVNGGKLDTVLKALNDAVAANQDLSQSNGLNPSQGGDAAGAALSRAALGLPEGAGDFVTSIRTTSATAQDTAALSALRNGYLGNLLQPCLQTTQGFPFVRGSTADADLSSVQQLFGAGGGLDRLATSLTPYVDQGGSWRWKADTPGDLDPASADRVRQAGEIKSILRPEGLQLKVSLIESGPMVNTATLRIGDASHIFTPGLPDATAMRWSTSGNGVASVTFTGQPATYEGGGDWALFRLFETAKVDSMGATAVRARFGAGPEFVVFKIEYPPGVANPFSGGPWTFRCPSRL